MLWFCGDGTADFDSEKSEKIAKIELTKVPIRAKIIEHVLGPFFYGQKPDCEQAEVPAAVNINF